jgi:hypothetical protein
LGADVPDCSGDPNREGRAADALVA